MPYNETKKSKNTLVEKKYPNYPTFLELTAMSQVGLATYLCHNSNLRHTPYVRRPNCDLPLSQNLQFFCPYSMSQVRPVTYLFI